MANSRLQKLAEILKRVVLELFARDNRVQFSDEPLLVEKDILEYDSRMRATAIDKFNASAYLAAVNFYRSEQDSKVHQALGVLILNLKETATESILKAVGIKDFEEDEPEVAAPKCGEFCQWLAQEYQKALIAEGYPALHLSQAVFGRNSLASGVEFCYEEYQKIDIEFSLKKNKVMVLELSLGPIHKN